MPKKTDGVIYELYPRPTNDEEGRPLLYPKPVIKGKYGVDDFDDFCARYRGTARGDMKRFFELCQDVASMWLRKGERVDTPFGSLAPKLKLNGDFSDPADVKGKDVSYAGLEFIPSKEFVEKSDCSHSGFRRQEHFPWERQRVEGEEALRKALRRSMLKGGYTTVKSFMDKSGLKETSARRYLNSLCEGDTPLLFSYLEGRNMHYRPIDEKTELIIDN